MFRRSGRAKSEKPDREIPDSNGGDARKGLAVATEDRGTAPTDSTAPTIAALQSGESSSQVGDAAAAGPSGDRVVGDDAAEPTALAEASPTAETIVVPGGGDGGVAHETATAEIDTRVALARTSNGSSDGGLAEEAAMEPGQPERPTRLCPHCAALSETAGDFCPFCGARFSGSARRGASTRVKVAAAAVVALLVLGGAGVAVEIKVHHDSQVAAQHRRAVAAARARAQAAAQAQAAQQARQTAQQAQQAAQVSQRQSLESQLQTSITNDATQKANQGVLIDGPALSTTCTPVNGGSSTTLSQSSGTYSCIAVYQYNGDGTSTGYDYTGTINFDTGSLTWRLGASP